MNVINAIIIDDELHCSDTLSELIAAEFKDVNIIEICNNPIDGITAISRHNPDLVFLDVEMREMTGFDMLKQLPEIDFELIFITAYDKYAIRAIKASALDFILKPAGKEELAEALSKVRMKFKNENSGKQLEVLYENLKQELNIVGKLAVPSANGMEIITVPDIVRLEGDSSYTTFHLKSKNKIMVSKTLKIYEELLTGHHFFRIHQTHLINLKFLKSYIKGEGGFAVMEDGSQLEVSRRRKEDFIKALQHLKF